MTTHPPVLSHNPYVGLRPYLPRERHLYFGREREAEVLFGLVFSTPVTLVYAPSGVGKSSLLQAGLLPRLQDTGGFRTVCVDSWEPYPVAQLDRLVAAWFPAERPVRWWYDALSGWHERTGECQVLVLDQFEEALRRPHGLAALWDQLAVFADPPGSGVRLVLGIREDHLADLDSLLCRAPVLIENGLRLGPMDRDSLKRAFHEPLTTLDPPFTAEAGLFEQLVGDLESLDPYGSGRRAEPGYFQIVSHRLWDLARDHDGHTLTLAAYRSDGGAQRVLRSYVRGKLDEALPREDLHILYAVLRYLVTPTGSKIPLSVDDLAGLVLPQDFTALGRTDLALDEAEDSRPLKDPGRRETTERLLDRLCEGRVLILRRITHGDTHRYELFHDLMGRVLLKWRERVRSEEERYLARLAGSVQARQQADRTSLEQVDHRLEADDQGARREAVRELGELLLRSNLLEAPDLGRDARTRLRALRTGDDRALRQEAARTLDLTDRAWDGHARGPSWWRATVAGICYLALSVASVWLFGTGTRRLLLDHTGLDLPGHGFGFVLALIALVWALLYFAEGFNDRLYARNRPWWTPIRAPVEPYLQGYGLLERISGWPFNFLLSTVPPVALAPVLALAGGPFLLWFLLLAVVFLVPGMITYNLAVVLV